MPLDLHWNDGDWRLMRLAVGMVMRMVVAAGVVVNMGVVVSVTVTVIMSMVVRAGMRIAMGMCMVVPVIVTMLMAMFECMQFIVQCVINLLERQSVERGQDACRHAQLSGCCFNGDCWHTVTQQRQRFIEEGSSNRVGIRRRDVRVRRMVV